jgi:hypothetical protein
MMNMNDPNEWSGREWLIKWESAFHGGPDVGELLLQPDLELGEVFTRSQLWDATLMLHSVVGFPNQHFRYFHEKNVRPLNCSSSANFESYAQPIRLHHSLSSSISNAFNAL